MPLVMLLHGYTSNGQSQENYMQFGPLSETYGFLYMHPDGTVDGGGNRFWNATDACCNFYGSTVDDSGYLLGLIDAVKAQCNVDPRRVYLIGHSNGGFMSYRMACDHPETIAAIASLAGATFLNPGTCWPASPVHVLQIHGTADGTVHYNGGCFVGMSFCYPGALGSAEQWATFGGCSLVSDTSGAPLDLVANLAGDDTTVARYEGDCAPGGSAELWTINGGVHVPSLSPTFSQLVIEYLLAHPKPVPADRDGDEDVDGVDFSVFASCFNGAGNPPRTLGCDLGDQSGLDFDDDGDIDGVDFSTFASCFNGAGNPPRTLGCPEN
jgi:polyhydroxybutyrate depolymerase